MKYHNIAFVSRGTFIPIQGGIQRVTDLLCRLLLAKGYKVFYFCMEKPTVEYDFPAPATFSETSKIKDARNGECYRRFLEENKIEVIINQDGQFPSTYFFLDKRFIPGHVKTISVIHSSPVRECNHLLKWLWLKARYGNGWGKNRLKDIARLVFFHWTKLKRMVYFRSLYRFLAANSSRICMLSERYVQEAKQRGVEFPEDTSAIPNPNTFNDEDIPCVLPKRKEVLYVGRLAAEKQIQLLLEVWKEVSPRCPEWNLILLGEGADSGMLKRLARRQKLQNVEFAGRQDPKAYYERAAILCLASLFEGFPMVLTEAQQFGVVPIAFESFTSVHSVITPGENGELVAPFSKEEYAQKLLHLMQDEPYRERLSTEARETVHRFDPERIADMWDALIQSL